MVLITADHGEHFGEHAGLFGHRYTLYSQEIRVPLLVIAPGRVPKGKVVSAPASLRDLPATVVDLAGLGPESSFPGRSLARRWAPARAGDSLTADPVFAEFDNRSLPEDHSRRLWRSVSLGDMVYLRQRPEEGRTLQHRG